MFVPGGEIRVDKEFLCFLPNKDNVFLPLDSGLTMEEVAPLSLRLSIHSFSVFLVRKALISALVGLEAPQIPSAGCTISLTPNQRGVKIRLFNGEEKKGSSFVVPYSRVIPLYQALKPSARYTEEIFSLDGTAALILKPDIDHLLMSDGSQKQHFDLAGVFLLREVLLRVLIKKAINIAFREGDFEVVSFENATRLSDITVSFGKFKTPLTKQVLVSILSVC
ncbi:hypothetical protein [Desulfurobacterium crinifex]